MLEVRRALDVVTMQQDEVQELPNSFGVPPARLRRDRAVEERRPEHRSAEHGTSPARQNEINRPIAVAVRAAANAERRIASTPRGCGVWHDARTGAAFTAGWTVLHVPVGRQPPELERERRSQRDGGQPPALTKKLRRG